MYTRLSFHIYSCIHNKAIQYANEVNSNGRHTRGTCTLFHTNDHSTNTDTASLRISSLSSSQYRKRFFYAQLFGANDFYYLNVSRLRQTRACLTFAYFLSLFFFSSRFFWRLRLYECGVCVSHLRFASKTLTILCNHLRLERFPGTGHCSCHRWQMAIIQKP